MMRNLNFDRIFFVGDSLSFMMAQSLWKLLGHLDDPGEQYRGGFERFVHCDRQEVGHKKEISNDELLVNSNGFRFVYKRNDYLKNEMVHPPKQIPPGMFDPDIYFHDIVGYESWMEPYFEASNITRTLLIANMGLHIHDKKLFEQCMVSFIDALNYIKGKPSHQEDVFFYRTSVPGHRNCGRHSAPFLNASEYVMTNENDWDKVNGYNDFAKMLLANITADSPLNGSLYLLDVYPMTLLRPDGHRPPGDCLHYYLPGPPDWWNHLLYNSLLEFERGAG